MRWIDQLFSTPIGFWFAAHRKRVTVIGSAVFLAMIVVSVKMAHGQTDDQETIEEMYAAWEKEVTNERLFKKLIDYLESDVRPNPYRCKTAQTLLALGKMKEAKTLSKEPLQRLSRIAPQHAEFANVSFLIASKEFQKALERAVSLKEKIEDRRSILYGKNLLRIAFLQQEVQNPAGEKVAWNEVEEFISGSGKSVVLDGLKEERIDFETYLKERQKIASF